MTRYAILLLALSVPTSVLAQNITRTIIVDTPLDVTGDPNHCSLREAVRNVVIGAATGTNSCGIGATTFTDEVTLIDLSQLEKPVQLGAPLTLKWNHAKLFGGTLDGAGLVPLLLVEGKGVHLYVDSMTFQHAGHVAHGSGNGGALGVSGGAWVDVVDSRFLANRAWGNGGGINFDGEGVLHIDRTLFENNDSNDYGGAISVRDYLSFTVENSRFSQNSAGFGGGAISVMSGETGFAQVSDSRFESNRVTGDGEFGPNAGGAIDTTHALALIRTLFDDNSVVGKAGGGGAVAGGDGLLRIRDSFFLGNAARTGLKGGAVLGRAYITRTGFASNFADADGGAVHGCFVQLENSTFIGNATGSGQGAALALRACHEEPPTDNPDDPLGGFFQRKIIGSTFAHNYGPAQIDVSAPALMLNSILLSEDGTPGCSGKADALQTRRSNSPAPTSPNAQWPGISCGEIVPSVKATLAGAQIGGYFDQPYKRTLYPLAGDAVACDYIGDTDQFESPRACLLGAVEVDPPAFQSPVTP